MDPKKILLEIFDKLLLGIVGAVFIAYLALAFLSGSPADKARDQVNKYNGRIVDLKERAAAGAPKAPASEHWKVVDAALHGGVPGEDLPGWLFHKRPVTDVRVKAEQGKEAVHLPPVEVQAKPGLGQISLSWQDNTKNLFVVVESYKVYRAEGEPKTFKEVASLDGKAHSFVDKAVQTRTPYWYYVESTAALDKADATVRKGGVQPLDPSTIVLKSDQIGPFTTEPDTYVEALSARPKSGIEEIKHGEPEHPADAYLKVWRYFESLGEWKPSSAETYVVDPEKPAKIGKKEGKLDFATDFLLVDVKARQVKHEDVGATMTQIVVFLKDQKTGQVNELVVGEPEPPLKKIKSNPKGGDADNPPPPKDPKKKN